MVLFAILAVAACSSSPRRLAQPQPNLLTLSIIDATQEGQRFRFELQLVNPNAEEIPVARLDFDIRLGPAGRLIGEHLTPFTLPPQASEIVTVEVFSEIVSSASQLMAFAQGPENVLSYEFHGEIYLSTGLREPVTLFRRGQVPLSVSSSAQ